MGAVFFIGWCEMSSEDKLECDRPVRERWKELIIMIGGYGISLWQSPIVA